MKTKTRIYGIDVGFDNQCDTEDMDVYDLSNEEFMDIAEQQGNVWTIYGFVDYFNECEASQIIARIIDVETAK